MAITFPLTHPTSPGFRTITWGFQSSVGIASSPYSFAQKVYDWGGKQLTATIELPMMNVQNAKAWRAFFLKLNGAEGTFYLKDTIGKRSAGSQTMAYPLVKGAGQSGQSLITDGWPANMENVLRAGDWFSISNVLYTNLNDVDTNASGEATLDVWPALRGTVADNAALEINEPQGIFYIIDPVSMTWNEDRLSDGLTFQAFESITA